MTPEDPPPPPPQDRPYQVVSDRERRRRRRRRREWRIAAVLWLVIATFCGWGVYEWSQAPKHVDGRSDAQTGALKNS